jgi:hypothetical protein
LALAPLPVFRVPQGRLLGNRKIENSSYFSVA